MCNRISTQFHENKMKDLGKIKTYQDKSLEPLRRDSSLRQKAKKRWSGKWKDHGSTWLIGRAGCAVAVEWRTSRRPKKRQRKKENTTPISKRRLADRKLHRKLSIPWNLIILGALTMDRGIRESCTWALMSWQRRCVPCSLVMLGFYIPAIETSCRVRRSDQWTSKTAKESK